jgi:hypothetical protein
MVPPQDMAYWLEEFERQRGRFGADVEHFLARVQHGEVVLPTIDLGITLFARLLHQPALIHACTLGGVRWPPHPYAISQRLTGDRQGLLTLTLTEPLLVHVASKMAGEPLDVTHPLCLEAAAEFLNTLAGNLVTRLGQIPIELDLEPPMRAPALPDDRAILVTLVTPLGEAGLSVLIETP